MKKLVLVIAITGLLAIGALAATYTLTPSLDVSGSYEFNFLAGNQGIDFSHKLDLTASTSWQWSPSFPGAFTLPATWTLSLNASFPWTGNAPSVSLDSLVYESLISKLTFKEAFERNFCSLMWGNGKALGLTYVYKPLKDLTLQYLDTTNDGASTNPSTPLFAKPYFKDEIAANYAGENYSLTGAMYYEKPNNYNYSYFVGMTYTGTGLTEGLSVKAAYGKDLVWTHSVSTATTWDPTPVSNNPVDQTALSLSYEKDFTLGAAGKLNVSASYNYFKNFTPKYEAFSSSDGKNYKPTYPASENKAYGKASYTNTLFGIFTVNPWIEETYDALAATKTVVNFGIDATATIPIGIATLKPTFSMSGGNLVSTVIKFNKTLDLNLSADVAGISFNGDINWEDITNFASPTWNLDAKYVKNVTFSKHATVTVTKIATDAKTGKAATITTNEATVLTKTKQLFSLEGYVTSAQGGPSYAGYYIEGTYNVGACYDGNMWTLSGYLGTLTKDSNGNYISVAPYWYIQASKTISF
ncbi:hypothetical protein [Mesoaciditoga sp.]